MAVYADLHVHTTVSDGALPTAAVPAAAREAGVSVVALTDHDRLNPALEAPVVHRDGVTLVHGVELRVEAGAGRVDLLGYGVRPTPALTDALDRLQAARVDRAAAMVACVEDRLDVSLDLVPEPGVGRPHVARAVAAAHPDYEVQDAFDSLLGAGCPCHVVRDVPDFEDGAALLADACALVGLAHPLRYTDPEAALELTASLDAVERAYPYGDDPSLAPVDRAIRRYDLVPTGGSDAHGEVLGEAGLDREAYDRVATHVP
jgi:predicted metal-dependent phosphoesterase TrpH